jgi:muramoyltetrapeptide carboxypeptidase
MKNIKLLKPKKLSKGDLIGIITPASIPDDLTRINKGVKYLESLGYKVEVGKNVGKVRGYLAGTDEERLEDLHYMFDKKAVKAIICARGGYGTPRLLDKIDYSLIKKNPKIFVGYSDITALQMAFFKKCGLVTFAGPMVAVDFWKEEVSKFTEEQFWRMITSSEPFGKLANPDNERFFVLNKGNASGTLLGGNLALITAIMGTEYLPSFENSVLMLEDIGEPPYRVDRMLNQIKLAKGFEEANAVVLGRFVDCYEADGNKSLTLNEVIADYFTNLSRPVIYNFKHGHISDNITVPFGVNCSINTDENILEITESAVE